MPHNEIPKANPDRTETVANSPQVRTRNWKYPTKPYAHQPPCRLGPFHQCGGPDGGHGAGKPSTASLYDTVKGGPKHNARHRLGTLDAASKPGRSNVLSNVLLNATIMGDLENDTEESSNSFKAYANWAFFSSINRKDIKLRLAS